MVKTKSRGDKLKIQIDSKELDLICKYPYFGTQRRNIKKYSFNMGQKIEQMTSALGGLYRKTKDE